MLHNSRIQMSHTELMAAITNVGYKIRAKGMCFGLANAGMQAILAGDLQVFLDTLVYISTLSSVELGNLGKFLRDRAESTKKLNPNEKLSQQEWDVLALFDIILMYQNPDAYRDLFGKNMRQNTREILVFTAPAKLRKTLYFFTPTAQSIYPDDPHFKTWQKQGLIRSEISVASREIGMLPVAYRHDQLSELTNLLNEIKKWLYLRPNMPNVALILGSPNHAITISYDVKDKVWIFIEINKLTMTSAAHHEIAKKIHEAFVINSSEKEDIVFNLRIYSVPMTRQQEVELHMSFAEVRKYSNAYITRNIKDIINIRFIDDKEKYSLLSVATKSNDVYVANKLLQAGIDLPARNMALVLAAFYGHSGIINMLLLGQVELNLRSQIRGAFKTSALACAAAGGFLGIVNNLIYQGADINLGDEDIGLTPLYHAALNNQEEVVRFLLGFNNIKIDFAIQVKVDILIKKIIHEHNIPEEKVEAILGKIKNGMEFIKIKPLQLVRLMGYDNIVEIISSHNKKIRHFTIELLQQIDKLLDRQTGNRTLFQFIGGMDVEIRKEKKDALTEMRNGLKKASALADVVTIVRGGFCDARLQKHADRKNCGMIYPDNATQTFKDKFSTASKTIQLLIQFLETKHHDLNILGVNFGQSDYFPPLEKIIDNSAGPSV